MSSRLPENLRDEIPLPPAVRQHSLPRPPTNQTPFTPATISALCPVRRDPRAIDGLTTSPGPGPEAVAIPRGLVGRLRTHPAAFSVLGLLVVMLVADVAGLTVYVLKVPKASEGPMVLISLVFVAGLIAIFGLIFRQCLTLHRLFNPRSPHSSAIHPSWLSGPPTYRDVLRSDGRQRGTDIEGWSGILPSYRDAGRDELLLKSTSRHSRGLSIELVEQPSITVEEVSSRDRAREHTRQPSIEAFC